MRHGFLIALSLSVLAGCGSLATMPVVQGPDAGALAYRAIGGEAYAKFQLKPELPKATGVRTATKLTYLMTDDGNGHQSPDSLNILKMMAGFPVSRLHNVVFRDGNQNGDTRLFYLNGNAGDAPQSLVAPGIDEVQSNNPKVISEVVRWTFDTYPAKYRYLQLYTHGAGLFGVGTDTMQTDTRGRQVSKREEISITPITQFAEAMRQGLRGRQLDLFYNQACLMGNIEALYELRGTARYVLASEDVTYSTGNFSFNTTKLFDDLANQGLEPQAIAKAMAIQGLAKRSKRPDGSFSGFTTLAAFDMSRIDEVKTAVNGLSLALTAALDTERATIKACYDAVPTVTTAAYQGQFNQHMRDLWAFTGELDKRVSHPGVKSAVQRLRSEQRRLMLHERDSFGSAANGLSIYMPIGGDRRYGSEMLKGGYQTLRFAKDTAWDQFLLKLLDV